MSSSYLNKLSSQNKPLNQNSSGDLKNMNQAVKVDSKKLSSVTRDLSPIKHGKTDIKINLS